MWETATALPLFAFLIALPDSVFTGALHLMVGATVPAACSRVRASVLVSGRSGVPASRTADLLWQPGRIAAQAVDRPSSSPDEPLTALMEFSMRSRLATRSARLALTAVATAVLATTAAGTALAVGGQSKAPVEQLCGTNDLTFKVTEKTQAGGYLLVTAKARPGITCYLEGTIPSAAFGSHPDRQVAPVEQAVTETVKLSGSTAAYAGINPKSTNNDDGAEFDQLIVAVAGDEEGAVSVRLPSTTLIDKPLSTNWHADPADAVPFSS
ncbi:DUF4232 domain-containing protein [Streptomyces sp. NPDC018029]|uniref:DUF4232 domain-containing protein n=1 Tax=Streptomyces sp. NPDC018029 TaxID=3365032 RepID=UPI0037B0F158